MEDGAAVHHVVEPWCCGLVAGQTVPTFSAPRIGSVEQRLAAITIQSVDASTRFGELRGLSQWIPSEVVIDLHRKAQFLTYISNVSPRAHPGVYESIASVTTALVPLFETLLSFMEKARMVSLRRRVVQTVLEVVELELNAYNARYERDEWRHHFLLKSSFSNRKDIVATGVYFAVVDNVTIPRLRFRRPFSLDTQDFLDGYADRCLVFQNDLDHMMKPLERIDTTKSGTVLMVKIHLVDPEIPVLSTANVRPSQREWTVDLTLGEVSRFFKLPKEAHDVIGSMLHWDRIYEELRPFAR